MHILVVQQYYLHKNDAGGSRWNEFARHWAEKGHQITVLASTTDYVNGKKHDEYKGRFIATEQEGPNVTVKRCHVSEAYNKNFLGRAWGYLSFFISSTIAGIFCAKPDVIVCTSPSLTVGLTGGILSKLKRVPMIFEIRDLWPESAIDTGVLTNKWMIKFGYWLERYSYRHASWINVLTPAFEEALIQRKGIPSHMISMIPNAADLDIIKPGPKHNWIRDKYGLQDKFIVTYLGAHGVANALMQLIEAADILKHKDPNIQIMLIGSGMQKSMLSNAVKDRKLNNVTMIDPIPKSQINDYINASDVCTAVLKKCETFKTVYPNKIFDYMAANKPIIIGIDGVARKLVEDASVGVFSEPENPQMFADITLEMKNHWNTWRERAETGREYVTKHYSRLVLSEKYLNIIEHIAHIS